MPLSTRREAEATHRAGDIPPPPGPVLRAEDILVRGFVPLPERPPEPLPGDRGALGRAALLSMPQDPRAPLEGPCAWAEPLAPDELRRWLARQRTDGLLHGDLRLLVFAALAGVPADRAAALVPPGGRLARLPSGDLTVLVPESDRRAARLRLGQLRRKVVRRGGATRVGVTVAGILPATAAHGPRGDWADGAVRRLVARVRRSRDERSERGPHRAPEVRTATRERQLLGLVERALRSRGFSLVFQRIAPIEAPLGGAPAGGASCEVLLRLRSPGGGTILPGAFLPVAARRGLLPAVDRWVVTSTLDWLQRHHARLKRPHRLAVNLSAQSIADPGFLDFVLQALRRSRVPPSLLAFEITENELLADLGQAARFVDRLRAEGCGMALDDFGRGFSSLSHVQSLQVDAIKVDGSFVRGVERDRRGRAVIAAVQHLADALGVATVAELVESRRVLESVRALGLHFAQGYAIARPRPLDELLVA